MLRKTPLKRGTKQLKRSGFKNKTKPTLNRTTAPLRASKSNKLPLAKTVRNKCDKLLTPIIKSQFPNCFLRKAEHCQGLTQVAHHFILKSKCTALRYDLENLIPLCHNCHLLLHSHESYYSSIIVERKGLDWFRYLDNKKNQIVKADVHFYLENLDRLNKIII